MGGKHKFMVPALLILLEKSIKFNPILCTSIYIQSNALLRPISAIKTFWVNRTGRKRGLFFYLYFTSVIGFLSCTSPTKQPKEDIAKSHVLNMTNWIPYDPAHRLVENGSILDVSHLLEAPAGKHGFVTVNGPKFNFEDGTEARFWGGNLFGEACFPEKKDAELLAGKLAQSGVNLIRLHHIDVMQPWTDKIVQRSLFGGQNPATTRKLDPLNLERLEYLIYCLKQKGIYVFMSHLSSRFVAPEDGYNGPEEAKQDWMLGFKFEGIFDPYLIELQKELLQQLLTHKNPYTGLALKDDPVLAMMEINNENHLYFYYKESSWITVKTNYYREMLKELFNDWLLEQYKSNNELATHWMDKEGIKEGLLAGENLSDKSVGFPIHYSRKKYQHFSENRKQDIFNFITFLQVKYYDEMYKFLKNEIGIKIPVAPTSQWSGVLPISHNLADYDFMDAHSYWKHPSKEYNYISGQEFIKNAMVKDPAGGNIGRLSRYRLHDKPFTISEWNNCLPNPYRVEGVPLMAAYCSMQDWHPMHYALYGQQLQGMDTINAFESMPDAVYANVFPTSSLLFHRKDVSEANTARYNMVDAGKLMQMDENVEINRTNVFLAKTGIAYTDKNQPAEADIYSPDKEAKGPEYVSENGELTWNTEKGLVTIRTKRSQGAIGFVGGSALSLTEVNMNIKNEFATVLVTSVTDQPILESNRLLITAIADAQMKGLELDEKGETIAKSGQFPFLMEPVEGQLSIKSEQPLKMYSILQNGERGKEIVGKHEEGFTRFDLKWEHQSVHYEVVR